jgi:hypothetical protein
LSEIAPEPTTSPALPRVDGVPEAPPAAPAPLDAVPTPTLPPKTPLAQMRRFLFLALPVIAVLELGAHLVQIYGVVPSSDWIAARDVVRTLAQPDDFIAFAPYWTDPLGREYFGSDLATVAREARPDDSRYRRGIEVSIRGQHLPELAGWKVSSTQHVGRVTVTVYENPAFKAVKDDLVDHVAPDRMAVSEISGGLETDCSFMRGRVETGGLGFGPAVPAERFVCPGGFIGASIMQPTDYRPHRCLLAPPLGNGKTLRVKFLGVQFGETLHGHTGIDWDSEHHLEQPGVTLVWKIGARTLARITDANGEGWKSFELNTSDLAGQTGELVAEVSSQSSHDRLYCFEADTR